MKRVLKKRISNDGNRGAILVELALVLPLLMILLLGIINMGLVIREHQVIQNAAREGARFSSLPQNRMDIIADPGSRADAIADRVVAYLNLYFSDVTRGARTIIAARKRYSYPISIGGVTTGNLLTIDQTEPIPVGSSTDLGSKVTVTYNRTLFIPGAPFFPFNSVTLTGNSVFHNLF